MVSFPHCKINLGLNILSKRTDGFHSIDTCFYPVPINDILEIIPSGQFLFSSSGIPIPGDESQNICVKACRLLQKEFDLPPVKIHLHKVVPMGAGLGGGSSDGAFALKLINEIFKLGLTADQLAGYASQLGSDCSYFLYQQPMRGTGRGEILEQMELDLKGKSLVLVKPPVHVSTADAYRDVKPFVPAELLVDVLRKPIHFWKDHLFNDFEVSIFAKYPVLEEIKRQLYESGAAYASMSGSGSSLFGLFSQPFQKREKFQGCDYWEVQL